MNAIVAVCSDWGIGYKNELLVSNKEDMKYFVQNTKGATVIVGKNTLESFPGGPLKGRRNVVIAQDENYKVEGAEVVHSIEEALDKTKLDENVWVIGGASIYKQMLPYCNYCYVTHHDTVMQADTFFPNLDEDSSWILDSKKPGGTTPDGIDFTFCIYKHI